MLTLGNDLTKNLGILHSLKDYFNRYDVSIKLSSLQINSELDTDLINSKINKIDKNIANILLGVFFVFLSLFLLLLLLNVSNEIILNYERNNKTILLLLFAVDIFLLLLSLAIISKFLKITNITGLAIPLLNGNSIQALIFILIIVLIGKILLYLSSKNKKRLLALSNDSCADLIEKLSYSENNFSNEENNLKSNNNNSILFISFSNLVSGKSASVERIKTFISVLSRNGYNCYATTSGSEKNKLDNLECEVFPLDLIDKKTNSRKKISYFYNVRKIKKILRFFTENKIYVGTIYIYSVIDFFSAKYLKKYAKNNNINIIFDVVEFPNFSSFTLKSFINFGINCLLINNLIIDNYCRVISISTYLNDFFSKKGITSTLIPYVGFVGEYKEKNNEYFKGKIVYLYAGYPEKKDKLSVMIEAFSKLTKEEQEQVIFLIVGVDMHQLVNRGLVNIEHIEKANHFIKFLGLVDSDVLNHLHMIADYTILLRDEKKRYAKAGFPTKIYKSLSLGVPVISNISSDLSEYLNSSNSFIVDGNSVESLINTLRLSIIHHNSKMRINAYYVAKRKLDISNYKTKLLEIIKK